MTSTALTHRLKREGIKISMDGRGQTLDEYLRRASLAPPQVEDIYLKGYANMGEHLPGLTEYFTFCNGERPHRSLANQAPDRVVEREAGQ